MTKSFKSYKYLDLVYGDFQCAAEFNVNKLVGVEFELVDNYDYGSSHTIVMYPPDLIKLRDFLNKCFGDKP